MIFFKFKLFLMCLLWCNRCESFNWYARFRHFIDEISFEAMQNQPDEVSRRVNNYIITLYLSVYVNCCVRKNEVFDEVIFEDGFIEGLENNFANQNLINLVKFKKGGEIVKVKDSSLESLYIKLAIEDAKIAYNDKWFRTNIIRSGKIIWNSLSKSDQKAYYLKEKNFGISNINILKVLTTYSPSSNKIETSNINIRKIGDSPIEVYQSKEFDFIRFSWDFFNVLVSKPPKLFDLNNKKANAIFDNLKPNENKGNNEVADNKRFLPSFLIKQDNEVDTSKNLLVLNNEVKNIDTSIIQKGSVLVIKPFTLGYTLVTKLFTLGYELFKSNGNKGNNEVVDNNRSLPSFSIEQDNEVDTSKNLLVLNNEVKNIDTSIIQKGCILVIKPFTLGYTLVTKLFTLGYELFKPNENKGNNEVVDNKCFLPSFSIEQDNEVDNKKGLDDSFLDTSENGISAIEHLFDKSSALNGIIERIIMRVFDNHLKPSLLEVVQNKENQAVFDSKINNYLSNTVKELVKKENLNSLNEHAIDPFLKKIDGQIKEWFKENQVFFDSKINNYLSNTVKELVRKENLNSLNEHIIDPFLKKIDGQIKEYFKENQAVFDSKINNYLSNTVRELVRKENLNSLNEHIIDPFLKKIDGQIKEHIKYFENRLVDSGVLETSENSSSSNGFFFKTIKQFSQDFRCRGMVSYPFANNWGHLGSSVDLGLLGLGYFSFVLSMGIALDSKNIEFLSKIYTQKIFIDILCFEVHKSNVKYNGLNVLWCPSFTVFDHINLFLGVRICSSLGFTIGISFDLKKYFENRV